MMMMMRRRRRRRRGGAEWSRSVRAGRRARRWTRSSGRTRADGIVAEAAAATGVLQVLLLLLLVVVVVGARRSLPCHGTQGWRAPRARSRGARVCAPEGTGRHV